MLTMPRIAVLVPCYNEAPTIGDVLHELQSILPEATIYVYDNNSHDNTAERAKKAGAVVRSEQRQGKGYVVRRMFSDIEADVYVMLDGDATYDVRELPKMVSLLTKGFYDMVVGCRVADTKHAYRQGHSTGNKVFNALLKLFFNSPFTDIFSGYRVFSRRFVKSFVQNSKKFEIETDLSLHALELGMPIAEVPTPYYKRPEGSFSKLSTYKDGLRILRRIIMLLKDVRPLLFYSGFSFVFLLGSLLIGIPVILDFFQTGLVEKLPSAILAASLMIMSLLSLTAGLILDSVAKMRRDAKKLIYLSIPHHTDNP
jgi:glycosyltransferase involved in cell wall biosynthesis